MSPIITPGGGGGGGSQPGTVLPVADSAGVTVDTTTYTNPITHAGKITTLVFPVAGQGESSALAIAIAGDAFPRWFLSDSATSGLYLGDGTIDPYNSGAAGSLAYNSSNGTLETKALTLLNAATLTNEAVRLGQVSPSFITSGALPTQQFVSGVGAQMITSRDTETHTPVTLTSAAGTCKIELSPDDVTYSELATVAPRVNAAVVDVSVRVPNGWFLRLTVTNATLGVTTLC